MCCALLVGCAVSKPVQLSDTEYINPSYSIKLKIPPAWEATKNIPADFKASFNSYNRNKIRLILANKKADGIICVLTDSTFLNINTITDHSGIKKKTEKLYKKNKTKPAPGVKEYEGIAFYPSRIYPSLIGIENFRFEDALSIRKVSVRNFIYPCRDDDTCVVIFILMSPPGSFNENNQAFLDMIDEFKKKWSQMKPS